MASGSQYFDVVDTVAPSVVSVAPADGTANVSPATPIQVVFSEEMDRASTESAFTLLPSTEGSFRWVNGVLYFSPDAAWNSNTQYAVTIDANARDIAGNNLAASYSWQFTTGVPGLSIISIDPPFGPTTGGTVVTIKGTGFVAGTAVTIGGLDALDITVVDSATITATTPPHNAGSVNVTVINPDSQSSTLTDIFTYIPLAPPQVTAISPANGPTAGGTAVTIRGMDFVPGATVTMGGLNAENVTVIDSMTITATTPAHDAGSVDVTVINPDAQSSVLMAAFTYLSPPPVVSQISPNSGTTDGGTLITITGSGFMAGATVVIGGAAASDVNVVDSGTIMATTPAHAAGSVDVTVANPDLQSITLINGYSYIAPPYLSGISPAYGPFNTEVTIQGSGFGSTRHSSVVKFNGEPAIQYNSWSETEIICLVPLNATTGPVTVATAYGISNEAVFTVTAPNQPPIAAAGQDQNATTGVQFILNGTESYDPEGRTITYLWRFVEVPEGSSIGDDSLTPNAMDAKPAFTPDVDGVYRLRLIVNDGDLDSAPDEVAITAARPNVAPNANAGADFNILVGQAALLNGTASTDPDQGPMPLSYFWSFVSIPVGSSLTGISQNDQARASFVPDAAGTYIIKLQVSDGDLISSDEVKIIASIPNVPPNANAGDDLTVLLGQTAVLDGSGSKDPDDGPELLSFRWRFVALAEGSNLTNEDIEDADTESPSFTPDVIGTFVLELTVRDGEDSAFDNVAVTVKAAPLAEAGGPYYGTTGAVIAFDASASHDSDGTIALYEWDWDADGTYDSSTSSPSISHAWSSPYSGTVVLRITDNDGLSATDDASVEVVSNQVNISGGAYFYPEVSTYRASFSMDATGPSAPSGWLKYYYARTRMNFVSTSITSVNSSGSKVTIEGAGTVNGTSGYTFIATVIDGSPDQFGIIIYKSGNLYYEVTPPKSVSGGNLVIQ